jgi:tetratricopeptide (TPR) repeat protein
MVIVAQPPAPLTARFARPAALAAILNVVPDAMSLTRLLEVVSLARRPTTVQLFRRAGHYRDSGRFEEAAELIASGLELDPDSTVGHLLAGSLHTVFREMHLARTSFERVLTLDPSHPRALLGLARISLEEGDREASVRHLEQALERYPDFPEARALLEVVTSLGTVPAAAPPVAALRIDRLRAPAEVREVLVARADGTLLAAAPRGVRSPDSAARLARLCRLAGAILRHAGLGDLEQAVLESSTDATFLRADPATLLCLALPREADLAPGLVHLERVWANCAAEIEAHQA